MKALLALFLTVFPLAAQFSNLATDDTGSRVRFSSALRLRGTQQSQFRKIFMADALSNVRLVAQVTSGDSYAILIDPEVSGDASVLVYTAYYDCSPAQSHCGVVDYTNGVISTANGTLTLPGNFHLSRNGRYVARENYAYFGPTGQFEIIDLTSLKKRSVPVDNLQEIIGGGRQVTSQGAVLAFTDVLWLFQPDGTAQLVPSAFPTPPRYSSASARAAVDDSGTNIVYQQTGTPCAIDLTGASDSVLPTTLVQSDQPCVMQTLSADGTTVLFISSANFDGSNAAGLPECWLVDTASKAIRSIGHDLAGIAEATLSGDGNVVWMVTMAGRLMRIERSTGVAQEVISRTAIVDQPNPFFHFPMTAAPGALVHLTGRGLAAQSAISTLPLATTVGGVQLLSFRYFCTEPSTRLATISGDCTGLPAATAALASSAAFSAAMRRSFSTRSAGTSADDTETGFIAATCIATSLAAVLATSPSPVNSTTTPMRVPCK